MKHTVIILAAALLPSIASADVVCDAASAYGRMAMTARQYGKPLPPLLKSIPEGLDMNNKEDKAAAHIMETVLLEAYKRTRFITDENRENAITDFESEVYVECEKDRRSKK